MFCEEHGGKHTQLAKETAREESPINQNRGWSRSIKGLSHIIGASHGAARAAAEGTSPKWRGGQQDQERELGRVKKPQVVWY